MKMPSLHWLWYLSICRARGRRVVLTDLYQAAGSLTVSTSLAGGGGGRRGKGGGNWEERRMKLGGRRGKLGVNEEEMRGKGDQKETTGLG